jgi:prepilin-type N-terminal cleavage/methylation domain-containing protein
MGPPSSFLVRMAGSTIRRAFTLLELTVVLTIGGLLLALSAPRFAALRDAWSVRSAMTDLAATFSLARETAIARRTPVAVVMDTAGGVVRVRTGGRSYRSSDLRVAFGVRLGANRDSAVYDPRGLGYGLSNLTVTVRRGGLVDTLTMSRLGRVRF